MKQIIITIIAALLLAAPKTATVTYKVADMHCKNCVAKITDNISFVKGVKDLKVSLDDKTVTIIYNPAKTDEPTLLKEIEKLGYKALKEEDEKSE